MIHQYSIPRVAIETVGSFVTDARLLHRRQNLMQPRPVDVPNRALGPEAVGHAPVHATVRVDHDMGQARAAASPLAIRG